MASLKTILFLGVCLSAWIVITAEQNFGSKVENVHWLSLDFKTVLMWTAKESHHKNLYNVQYTGESDTEWKDCRDCTEVSEIECDLTMNLLPPHRTYTAKILTVPETMDYDADPDVFPQTTSPTFNPYRESNISSVKFTVEAVDERTVTVNITDILTSIHENGKQLTIRDIFKNDLKYKVSYYKSGSTRKRDFISDSSMAVLSELDAGQSYCFMIAAYIPSRPRTTQQGAWSEQFCMKRKAIDTQGLTVGAWVGVFILLTVLIIISTVTILCYRRYKQRYQTMQTSQASGPI
nr:PREDICTED: tissue factor isoform X1 [Paralichthys olivaceus]